MGKIFTHQTKKGEGMRVTIEKRKADNEGKQALRLAFYLGSSIDPGW